MVTYGHRPVLGPAQPFRPLGSSRSTLNPIGTVVFNQLKIIFLNPLHERHNESTSFDPAPLALSNSGQGIGVVVKVAAHQRPHPGFVNGRQRDCLSRALLPFLFS
ncbi:hypothetical protein VTN96DRAFT_2841 [Rasamsonia emersonii]